MKTVLWDTRTATARPLGDGYATVAFTPDSRRFVLATSGSGVLKLFDAEGTELADFAADKGEVFGRPVVSPNGKRLAAYQGKDRIDQPCVLRVCDLSTLKGVAAFQPGGDVPFVTYTISPDSRRLAATDYKGGVHVWDIATGRPVQTKSFGGDLRVSKVVFAPDGRRLAVLGQPKWNPKEFGNEPDPRDLPQPRVSLFDLAAPAAEPEVVVCPHGYTGGLAFSPDGRTLAVGGTGAVHLFEMTDPPGRKR
jgi:WD40 repeat protein